MFSPDGAQVLTASGDGTARLWATATGRELRRFQGHSDKVMSAVFSPDGAQVLTASWDETARLWETATGRELRRLEGHFSTVSSAVFSPDSAQVLTASWDQIARLWETATGRELRRFEGHSEAVRSAVFSPDGAQVLTASADDTARLWETATGKELRHFEGHSGAVGLAVFSPDGAQVLTASYDKTARLWETATGRELRRFEGHSSTVESAVFSPDGAQVLTASWDGTARLWATATGRELRRFQGHSDKVMSAVFSPDGAQVLTASHDGTARLWETATGRELRRFEGHSSWVSSAVFSPDGAQVLTASWDQTARLWETATGRELRRFEGHSEAVASAVFSPDGAQVLTASHDKTARLWEAATGKELRRFEGHSGEVTSAVFSPDGAQVLTASWDKTARLWATATGRELRRFEGHSEGVDSAVFSPGGAQVLTASDDKTARLWATATGRELRRFEGHSGELDSAVFWPDGTQVLTASYDTTARLWETATGRELRRFEGHDADVISAVFSPDGAQVLTASGDHTARLWETATGRELRRFEGHSGWVSSAALSRDGAHVLTASWDGTTRLWDAATRRQLCSLISFRGGGWAVTDPMGRYDASDGGDVEGLHWVVGMEAISLDQLKSRYYEPGLLAKHLGLNKEPLREVAAFTAPRLFPSVKVEQQDGRVLIHLKDRGGGIGPVAVLVNGKERTGDARGPKPDPDARSLTLMEDLAGDPRLLPGEPSRIEVFAYNAEGYLRTRGAPLSWVPAGARQAPSLWAVVAGVSDYRGQALDLKFAAQDAQEFGAALTTAGAALFGAERTHVSVLPDARRQALSAALQAARQAKAGDILVIYLAGHSVNRGEGFYFLTAEAESADLSDPAQQAATALSSSELTEAIKEIPALKQVLILDTCASESFIEALTGKRAVPSSQVRALERVKDRTGMFVLAGCASDRVSYEATPHGQGLLTYSLLLGMKDGQLREEEYVDVSTLFNFAADRVQEFAKNVGGVQRPIVAAPRGRASFDIGRLTAQERARLPLHSTRPLFSRATFLDFGESAGLELSQRVNDVLSKQTTSSHDGALVYLDVPGFPGAFQIAGTHVTQGGITKARFRLHRDKQAVTDWIEVAGAAEELAARIVEEARRHLPASPR